jgi:hypothetical protein
MVFERSTFLEFSDDPRYEVLTKAIKADSSNASYEITRVPPQTAPSTLSYALTAFTATNSSGTATASMSCYNNGATHWIDIYFGSNYKMRLFGTFLMMKYSAQQIRTTGATTTVAASSAYVGVPIDPASSKVANTGYSIPFHPAAWFANLYLQSGANQENVEDYVFQDQIGNICSCRAIQEYKREALEAAHDNMFTPCIETAFDDLTLSAESILRAQTHLLASGTMYESKTFAALAGNTTGVKAIPLSDLFSTCTNDGFWQNSNKIRIQFTMKTPDKIAFCSNTTLTGSSYGAAGSSGSQTYGDSSQSIAAAQYCATNGCSPVYCFVNSVEVLVDSARMTASQAIDSTVEIKKENKPMNIGYMKYFPVPAQSSSQIVVTQQRDVQQVALGFEAYRAASIVNKAAGPVQNYLQKDDGSLNSVSILYGNEQTIRQPMQFDHTVTGNELNNTIAYTLYKKSCNAERSNLVSPAVPFSRFPFYNWYFFPIFPSNAGVHLTSDGRDIRIDNSATTSSRQIVSMCKRFQGVQIEASGAVSQLN